MPKSINFTHHPVRSDVDLEMVAAAIVKHMKDLGVTACSIERKSRTTPLIVEGQLELADNVRFQDQAKIRAEAKRFMMALPGTFKIKRTKHTHS